MSYTKLTDYAAKDLLIHGDPAKQVKGSEIGADFDAIAVADSLNSKTAVAGTNAINQTHAATSKATPVNADEIGIWDSVSGLLNKLTWANLKDTLVSTANTWTAAQTFSGGATVPYTSAGAGAVATTVQGKLRESVSVKDFGAVGDGVTDDTAAIQLALNYLSTLPAMTGSQGRIFFPRGDYVFSSTLKIPSNALLVGEGVNFATTLLPAASFTGAQAITIDGTQATGGAMFRVGIENITINATNFPTARVVLMLQDCYTIAIRNVYIYNAPGTLIQVKTSAGSVTDILFDSVHAFGVNTTNGLFGFDISAGKEVRLTNCDVENLNVGIRTTGVANVITDKLYVERCVSGVIHQATDGGTVGTQGGLTMLHATIEGGANTGLSVYGDNCVIVGGIYNGSSGGIRTADASTRPKNLQVIGASTATGFGDTRNWITRSFIADYTSGTPTVGVYRTVDLPNAKLAVASGAASNVYKITGAYNDFGSFDMDLMAQPAYFPSTVYTARYRIGFGAANGSMVVTAVTEYGKANINGSSTLAIVVTATATSATEITIVVTPTLTGAVTTANIHCTATLVQGISTGGTYLTTL